MQTRLCVRIVLKRIRTKNKAMKVVSKAIREKADKALTELQNC